MDRPRPLRKQREYQEKCRKRVKAARTPDREEIARELLHYAITENLKRKRELWQIAHTVIERLVARGQDREASRQTPFAIHPIQDRVNTIQHSQVWI